MSLKSSTKHQTSNKHTLCLRICNAPWRLDIQNVDAFSSAARVAGHIIINVIELLTTRYFLGQFFGVLWKVFCLQMNHKILSKKLQWLFCTYIAQTTPSWHVMLLLWKGRKIQLLSHVQIDIVSIFPKLYPWSHNRDWPFWVGQSCPICVFGWNP